MKTLHFVTYFLKRNGLGFVISQFFFSFTFLAQFPTSGNGVFDFEGNFYSTVILENEQEWMAENLKSKVFSNGDSIQNLIQNNAWQVANTAAYSIYTESGTNSAIYGNLYNWFVTIDERNICPSGWHVPNDNEWTDYSDLLGGNGIAGGKMKTEDTLFWKAPNLGATNESLFSGLPAGCRYNGGNFANIEKYAYWWSSTQLDTQFGWYRSTNYLSDNLVKNYEKKQAGYSIRCLKNQAISIDENNKELTFSISPNPFTENIIIKTKEIGKILLLQNMYGETIQSIQLNSVSEVFATEQLSSGIYFIVDFSTMTRIKLLKH
jgi:uncharacterized protein (TIGR02145 family)